LDRIDGNTDPCGACHDPCPVCASGAAANGKSLKKPKLVLQIVVDQLRGDLPLRYLDRFGNKGFRLLFEQGTHYDNAHFQHANTETLVGHSVLATGAFPSHHGMVANKWYDREKDSLAYIIEDSRYPVLNSVVKKPESAKINPSKRTEKGFFQWKISQGYPLFYHQR
jgi:predicted AlkP superfamily pyrophosphatase or phosphodiesterase